MKQLGYDIIGFLKNISQVDLLLYFGVLILIILVVSLIYIIKNEEEEYTEEKEGQEELDLKEVVTKIENTAPSTIDFTSYEKDQEEKAIISYDELIAKNKTGHINYNEEKVLDDEISIRKIDLDHMLKDTKKDEKENTQILFKYANEEAFLKALQTLNELLN